MFDFKRRRQMRGGLLAVVATVLSVGLVTSASAREPANAGKHALDAQCDNQGTGHAVPINRISIQEWTFAEYIGFGTDAATHARLEEVIEFLSDTGYRNIELFTLSGLSAEQMRALLDEYGLEASSRHVNVGTPAEPVDFEQILEENQTLGIRYFGSGGTPRDFTTEAQWIEYAEYLNELGAQARRVGQRLMVHNHNWEFEQVFGDRSAFDILVEHTNRRNVYFQVDLYWATRGLGVANNLTDVDAADDLVADLLEQLGIRARLAHVKDMSTTIPATPGDPLFPGRIEIVGKGGIDFPSLFAATAASNPFRYFVVEHDPRFEDPTFDPFEAAEAGFEYLSCVRY